MRPAGIASPLPHSLSGRPIEILAETQDTHEPFTQFAQPVTIELTYADAEVQGSETSLSVFWYDPLLGTWRPLPTLVDPDANVLTAQTDHLTVFDFNTQDWEAARLPNVAAFQVAPFTGAATYSMQLEVPPGPGGLQPSLTLSYNSQVVDGADNRTQASWVGMGWSLDTGYIQRNMHGTLEHSEDDTFTLVAAGVSSLLLPVPDADGDPNTDDYKTADDSFWRIRRYRSMVLSGYWQDTSYWLVWDKSGNKYTFSPGPYYPEYPGCFAPTLQRWQWPITSVRNAFGQELTYGYAYEDKISRNNCDSQYQSYHNVAVYPVEIRYPNGRYRIAFVRAADRTDHDPSWGVDYQAYTLFQRSRLTEVRVEHDANGDGTFEQLIRRYVFTYEDDPGNRVFPNVAWPAGGRTLTLAQVQEFGLDDAASLPSMTFTYGDNMHLTRADNGYGGRVEFTYERWNANGSVDQGNVQDVYSSMPPGTEVNLPALNKPVFYPGSVYRFEGWMSIGYNDWAQYGINYGGGIVRSAQVPYPPPGGWQWVSDEVTLPPVASQALPTFTCSWCYVGSIWMRLRPTRYTVVEKAIYDGVSAAPQTFSYSYAGTAMNDWAHSAGLSTSDPYALPYTEFRGHESMTEIGPDGRTSTSWYYQDDVLKGRAYKLEVGPSGGSLMTEDTTAYESSLQTAAAPPLFPHKQNGPAFTDLKIYWIRKTADTHKVYEGDSSWVGTSLQYSYDAADQGGSQYGNLTRTTSAVWSGSAWQAYRSARTGFFPSISSTQYLVGLPAFQDQYACPGGSCESIPAAQTLYLYDDSTSFTAPPSAGQLTGMRVLVDSPGGNARFRDEIYDYDTWGNRTSVTAYTGYGSSSSLASSGPRTATAAFEPTYHTYALQALNPAGHPTSWEYNYALGLPVQQTDANGGIATAGYDPFGRLEWLRKPGDESGPANIAIAYYDSQQPYQVAVTQRLDATTTTGLRRFYNGLGQLIQTQFASAELDQGISDVLTDSWYDAYGRITRQSVPYAVSPGSSYRTPDTGQPYTLTEYDILGRATRVISPDSTETLYDYDDLARTATDALGRATTDNLDVWGRSVQVSPSLPPSASYTYDVLDRLTQVTYGSAVTLITYDNAGRKLEMTDADMGHWSYVYDALGNLLTQTDARACTTTMTYDALSRQTARTYLGAGFCATTAAVGYTYDVGTYGIGHRTGMTDDSGSTNWTYDVRGRLTEERKTVSGAGVFVTGWGYNSADQVVWMNYPGGNAGQPGEQVNYSYHPQGSIESLSSSLGTYVQAASYDASGRITDLRLGNDVLRRGYSYYPWTSLGGRGRLEELTAGTPAEPTSLMDVTYAYDLVGNITAMDDWRVEGWQVHDYDYDALDRLTGATVAGGGAGSYSETYTYDATTGNLAGLDGVAYGYDAAHPHAVTRLDGVDQFWYDADGSMIERHANQTAYTMGYDAENRMVSVASVALAPTPTPTASPTPAGTPWPTPSTTPTAAPDLVFRDGFESGTLSAWSSATTDGGDLSVSGPAGIGGGSGLQVLIDDNTLIYVTDQTPNALSRYRARFYFDPNSIAMASGNAHYLFYGYTSSSTVILRLEIRSYQGDYQLRAGVINDAGSWSSTPWSAFRDQRHLIELDWRAATGAGANNGGVTLWIDETQVGNFSNIDNDGRRMDFVRLGPVSGIDSGTRGTYFIDAFESRSSTYIGPEPGAPGIPAALPVDAVFDDGFEGGTMAAWSANTPGGGDLSVAAPAALSGAYGLRAVLNDNTSIYVTDWTPFAERRYRARFHFDSNTISMASGDAHYLFYGYLKDTTTGVLRLEFRSSGGYQVRAEAATDGSSWSGTSWYSITDAPHYFELDWQASSGPGANNGVLKLWIDGVLKQAISNIDNDTRQIDWLRLGAVSGVDTGTRGTYYFDAFASRRSSYLGQHYENVTATFVYDGDGRRVKSTVNGVTTVIVGDHYEVRTDGEGAVTREYYFAGSSPIAVRELPSGKLSWLLTDHLGSISAVADANGALTAELRYRAFGDVRYAAGISPTTYQYTGQRAEPLLGIHDYRARWYDSGLGRFAQADTIVPGGGPMAWDRYAYAANNPLRYLDPTGHSIDEGCGFGTSCTLPPFSTPNDLAEVSSGQDPQLNDNGGSRYPMAAILGHSGNAVRPGDSGWKLAGFRFDLSLMLLVIGYDLNLDFVYNQYSLQDHSQPPGFVALSGGFQEGLGLGLSLNVGPLIQTTGGSTLINLYDANSDVLHFGATVSDDILLNLLGVEIDYSISSTSPSELLFIGLGGVAEEVSIWRGHVDWTDVLYP
jgi:RHS repeat-associated protein